MFRPRVIPVLLLKGAGLIKSVKFKSYKYIGDPINAVRIFNDMQADELVFLDIDATREKRIINLDFVRNVGEEANMPFAVGGGIQTIQQIREILAAGAEKVIVGHYATRNPGFIREAADIFGTSTIAVCIDVKKHWLKGQRVFTLNATAATPHKPVEFARLMEEMGAGELILQSVDHDGLMHGYDLELISEVTSKVTIPVVALGGAGNPDHLREGFKSGASALAAGSLFVFHGSRRGVLINYPEKNMVRNLFFNS